MARRTLSAALATVAIIAPTSVFACAASPTAAFERFVAAFNALDWASFKNCLADDVSLFNPDIAAAISLRRIDGRKEVERSFRAIFDAAGAGGPAPHGPNIVPEHISLARTGDAALVTFEFKRSEHSFGRRSLLLTQVNGEWRVSHIHASNVDTNL